MMHKNRHALGRAVLAASLAWMAGASAHHSAAMYDASKTLQVRGTLKTAQIGNPHSWLWVAVLNAQNGVDLWSFEGGSVAQLEAGHGDIRHYLTPGQKVTVSYHPLRDGRLSGELVSVQLENGLVLPQSTPGASSPAK